MARHLWRRWGTVVAALVALGLLFVAALELQQDDGEEIPLGAPATTPDLSRSAARVRFPARDELAGFSDVGFGHYGDGSKYDIGVSPEDEAAWARGAGATLHRVFVDWARWEPQPGKVDAVYRDRLAAFTRAFEAAGGRVLYTLGQSPGWAREPGACTACFAPPADTPAGLRAWRRYVASVARAFPHAAGYEVWNEPNLPGFWGNRPPDAARYVRLMRGALDELRRVAPDRRVLVGALAGVPGGNGAVLAHDYLRDMAAAGLPRDVRTISYHAYPDQNGGRVRGGDDGPGDVLVAIEQIREVIRDVAPRARQWITETGASRAGKNWALDPDEQADVLLRLYNELAHLSRVDAVLLHQLIADTTQPASSAERGYGIVEPRGDRVQQATPAWCALRAAAADPAPLPLGARCAQR